MRFIRKIFIFVIMIYFVNNAAVVSDNDGSAFITKAEFDSLKNNFQTQIDKYNQSIDAKIDTAIASYLSGIKVSRTEEIKTAFSVIGNAPTTTSLETIRYIEFFGKNVIPEFSENVPYTSSSISWVGTIGYGAQEMWSMDANNTLQVKGAWTDGDTDNKVIVSDDGYVEELLTDVKVKENRMSAAQARQGTILYTGGVWKSISLSPDEPTEAQVNQWTTKTTKPCLNGVFEVRGIYPRGSEGVDDPATLTPPDGDYNWVLSSRVAWYRKSNSNKRIFFVGYGAPNIHYLDTSYTINYASDKKLNINFHWPFGSDNQVMVKAKVKDSSGNETKKGHYTWGTSSIEFTKSIPFGIATGMPLYVMGAISGIGRITTNEITIQGVTPHLNCSLNSPANYKYNKIKTNWDADAKLTGGLLLMDPQVVKDGTLEIELKSDTNNTWLYFRNEPFSAKPNEDDTSNLECEILDEVTGNYVKTYNPKLVTSGTSYKIKIPTQDGKSIYLGLSENDSDTGYDITLSQVGTAQMTYSN